MSPTSELYSQQQEFYKISLFLPAYKDSKGQEKENEKKWKNIKKE